MNVKGYIEGYPVFNTYNKERHRQWEERVETLDEVIDMAEKVGNADEDLQMLGAYREVVEKGLRQSRSNDRKLSVTKAVTHAAAFGFVGALFNIFRGDPGNLANLGMRVGVTIACGATMVGGELLFRSFLAKGQACGDEPQRSIDQLGPNHKAVVAEYLLKKDSMKEVLQGVGVLKTEARGHDIDIDFDGESVEIGGFVLDFQDDEPVAELDLPPADPRFR